MDLTLKQQRFFDFFDSVLSNKSSQLLSSHDRAWGKTHVLNEIGLTYQALGYEVLLITQHGFSNEHIATRSVNRVEDIRGIKLEKTIAIIDEYKYFDDNFQHIKEYLDNYRISYVGFVNFGLYKDVNNGQ